METVVYGRKQDIAEIPNLVEMQTKSYRDFLQPDIAADSSARTRGWRPFLREVFPIYSYDKTLVSGVHQLRVGEAALLAGGVPQTADDVRVSVQDPGASWSSRSPLRKKSTSARSRS